MSALPPSALADSSLPVFQLLNGTNSTGLLLRLELALEDTSSTQLTWSHVALAFGFILFDAGLSTVFRLGVGLSLLIAAARCIGQLAVVATLLQQVFENKNPWLVALIAFILNLLGTFETVINKSPRRFHYMHTPVDRVVWQFPAVLVAMLGSTIPISILGSKYAMSVEPFWTPIQFIPIVGMLCGATISGIVVAVSYILKEFHENRDKVEMYLAFGSTRVEACRPIVVQALKLALTPPINNMSVMGIIAIPGMMTGAILGGSSVQQAAKLQIIIMFMITASTVLTSVFTVLVAITVVVDQEHRVRSERILKNGEMVIGALKGGWNRVKGGMSRKIEGWREEYTSTYWRGRTVGGSIKDGLSSALNMWNQTPPESHRNPSLRDSESEGTITPATERTQLLA